MALCDYTATVGIVQLCKKGHPSRYVGRLQEKLLEGLKGACAGEASASYTECQAFRVSMSSRQRMDEVVRIPTSEYHLLSP